MELKDHQIDTLRLLATYEEAIGSLYQLYSEKFPEEKDFWLGLYHDEAKHALWIKNFYGKIEQGDAFFKEGRFNVEAIESNINHIREKYHEAESGQTDLINAISIALDLERSILENKYYDIFGVDSYKLKNLLQSLADATKVHAQKVADKLAEHQPSQ